MELQLEERYLVHSMEEETNNIKMEKIKSDGNTVENPLILRATPNKFYLSKRIVVEDDVELELVDKQLLIDATSERLEFIEFVRNCSPDYGAVKILERWNELQQIKNNNNENNNN